MILLNDKSCRIDSYQEGKYHVSVRKNLENDRVDEGDYPKIKTRGRIKYRFNSKNK